MFKAGNRFRIEVVLILIYITIMGCRTFTRLTTQPEPTQTPTDILQPQTSTNACENVTGTVAIQILVGPSEAVGLESVAVGELPFAMVAEGESYAVEGGGQLDFEEQVLESEWGTYSVTFKGEVDITGVCVPNENEGGSLELTLVMIGEQMVEVHAEGFQMDFPWSGTPKISVSFPLEDGAQQSGEGWNLILHLNR